MRISERLQAPHHDPDEIEPEGYVPGNPDYEHDSQRDREEEARHAEDLQNLQHEKEQQ